MKLLSSALALTCAFLANGCATYDRVAAGPTLVATPRREASERGTREVGIAAEVSTGEGHSTAGAETQLARSRATFADATARVSLAPHHQSISGLVGVSTVHSIADRQTLDLGLDLGLGAEHAIDRVFIEPIVRACFGIGLVLRSTDTTSPGWPEWDGRTYRPARIVSRERKILTLDLAPEADFRLTRAPLFAVTLLVGLMTLEESFPVLWPPIP